MKVCYFLGLENFKMEGRAWLKRPVFGYSGLGNTLTCPESGLNTMACVSGPNGAPGGSEAGPLRLPPGLS